MSGGALALLCSILESDWWSVTLCGSSWLPIETGMPEGCRLGPPLFNFLPDTLVVMLLEHRCGVARKAKIPAVWNDHVFRGWGCPDETITMEILSRLRSGTGLPTAEWMADVNNEASALGALDLLDPYRIPVLFQADDPVFLASSKGEMVRVMGVIGLWCKRYKTSLRCTSNKSVILVHSSKEACNLFSESSSFVFESYVSSTFADLHGLQSSLARASVRR